MAFSKTKLIFTLSFLSMTAAVTSAQAQSVIEPDYTHEKPLASTAWYVPQFSEANKKADLDFIIGMRPHHAGALSMVNDYFKDKKGTSVRLAALARGIKHNQSFEISMLDKIEHYMQMLKYSKDAYFKKVADQGLAQKNEFIRLPMPPIQSIFYYNDHISEEDVRFAKAMIVHHEGALIMAQDYLDNPDANNGYLRQMCLDILRDQKQEIALMHNIIKQYKGDADAVKITPDMIHGMDGMMHHMNMGGNMKHHH